ncbi:MAG: fibronectin type protein, partial [Actinomycetia bacterium]|nr:fibronectin type protein [Actinomycetes bacterium]
MKANRPRVRPLFRALGLLLVAATAVPLATAPVAVAATPPATTFTYTGTVAEYTVPAGVHYVVIDTWGAQGGGLGGHAGGTIAVTPGEVLRVRVGGSNGFNGGGAGGTFGGNGGGATDVRQGGDTLADRVVVGGGGGGNGDNSCCSGIFSEPVPGDGGGVRGGDGGGDVCDCGGHGATQTAGGAGACGSGTLGSGADACSGDSGGGGGGGGLYGGGSASGVRDTSPSCAPFCGGYGWGGGGGSGYVAPSAFAARNETGVNQGDGHASIRRAAAPSAPQRVFAFPLNGRVPVGWSPPTNNDLPVTGYTVRAYRAGVLQQTAVVAPTARSYMVTGLTNGKTYGFTVAASNATGTGAASAPLSVRVGTPVFLQLPTASPGNGSMTVSWHPPITNGSDITRYTLTPYRSGVAQTSLVFGPATTSTVITGLTNGDLYTFTVKATNANGTGPPSDQSVAVNVGGPGPPGTPSAAPGNASATVSWTAPATNNGSPVVGYVVTPYVGGGARVPRVYNSTATTQ